MILDNLTVFSGAVSATGVLSGQAVNGAGNVISTNTMDLGPLPLGGNQVGDFGAGEPIDIEISVLTAPTGGTTVKFQLIQADDAALSTNVQVLVSTDDLPIANLLLGTLVPLRFARVAPYTPKRYVGLRYVNTGAIATATYFSAIAESMTDVKNIFYRSGFTVT